MKKAVITLALIVFTGLFLANSIDASLVLYAPLDENTGTLIRDYSGNANVGSENGVWFNNGSCIKNSCVKLITSGQYISFPYSNSLNLSRDFTLSFWINAPSGSTNPSPLIWYQSSYNTYGSVYLDFIFSTSQVRCGFVNTLGNNEALWSDYLLNADLYKLDCVRNSTTLALYVNGTLINSTTVTNNGIKPNYPNGTIFGYHYPAYTPSPAPSFIIDEIKIWNNALYPEEIYGNFVTDIYSGDDYQTYTDSEFCINQSYYNGYKIVCNTPKFKMPETCVNLTVSVFGNTTTSSCGTPTNQKFLSVWSPSPYWSPSIPYGMVVNLTDYCNASTLNYTLVNPYLTVNDDLSGKCECIPSADQYCSNLYCNVSATCEVPINRLSFSFSDDSWIMDLNDVYSWYQEIKNLGGLPLLTTLSVSDNSLMRLKIDGNYYTSYTLTLYAGQTYPFLVDFKNFGTLTIGNKSVHVSATASGASDIAYYYVEVLSQINEINNMTNETIPEFSPDSNYNLLTGTSGILNMITKPMTIFTVLLVVGSVYVDRLTKSHGKAIPIILILGVAIFSFFGIYPGYIGIVLILLAVVFVGMKYKETSGH